ncbi:hypothetical protein PSACC_03311 [Paramicrosporidium saccamoebae]|uniref:Cyclin N-terminal domain-containing protein n=1 Tax=Paramicrosporidium saccamoebae TaxID=1246581 RepID=A0A2H9TGM5_9FUNG|nr:hypothetical protein PSACC_03311 [Paramicrosporidium saccamoebae]
MDSEEEGRFLATAYRFLSGISYGGPIQHLRYPIPGSGMALSPSTPREDGLKIAEAKDWLHSVAHIPFVNTKVKLLPPKGGSALCVFSLKGHVPPAVRKAKGRPDEDCSKDFFRQPNRKVQSYRHLLPHLDSETSEEEGDPYNPNFLDDPELRTGKHRTVIALTSFLGSINHFTKAEFLKRELNEKFRKLHPSIHPTLTLSQLRNLKTRLLHVALSASLELSTVARSYAYLEKLVLLRAVHKRNRRVVGGCCLVLAAKATDTKSVDYGMLLGRLASDLGVARRELVELEFGVLSGLHFRLQIPEREYGAHLERILSQLDYSNLQEYLGERMHESWQMTLE